MSINPQALSLNNHTLVPKQQKTQLNKRHKHFISGPLPVAWFRVAAQTNCNGLRVALGIWYLSGLNRRAATVRLSSAALARLGISRHAGYRGLKTLEKAGLVNVKRHRGRLPIVTILDVEEEVGEAVPANTETVI